MIQVNPLLLAGGLIGTVSALLVFAYATVKDKKTSMGFERNIPDSEIVRRLAHYARPYLGSFAAAGLLMLFSIVYDIVSPLIVGYVEEMLVGDFALSELFGMVAVYAGILLFSEHPRRTNRGAFMKIGEFDGNGVLRREDIIDAPLILVPDLAVDILFDRYIPPTFRYEGALRRLVDPYPRDGIRELIVNAVVHMDYRSKEPVTVSVHPDRVEVFGFGGLPDGWTVETLIGRHRSIPRNQTLADVFHDAGYVENWAQGIRRVMESCEVNGNPRPEFVLEREGLSVTISSAVRQTVETTKGFVPTDNQRLILDCIASDPSITQRMISETTGLSERTVRNNLSKMVDAGMVHREGSRKDGKWVILSDRVDQI